MIAVKVLGLAQAITRNTEATVRLIQVECSHEVPRLM